jgi:predicted N-acetyltransferase YhbS
MCDPARRAGRSSPAIKALQPRVPVPAASRGRPATHPRRHAADLALLPGETAPGRLIAAIRFTEVTIGSRPGGLLLGPLAVDPEFAGQGYGRRLVGDGLEHAKAAGMGLSVLVGDEPYYARFGFVRVPPCQIWLGGPADPARILAAELAPGALAIYRGLVSAR